MALNRITSRILTSLERKNVKQDKLKNTNEIVNVRSSAIPKLLDKGSVSKLVEVNIFSYLTDSDVSNLAVNKMLAARTISDTRWISKLKTPLFNGLYLNYLLDQIGNGNSILIPHASGNEDEKAEVEKEEKNPREVMVQKQVDMNILDLENKGINNFQTIYARYKKLSTVSGRKYFLDTDKITLLSGHHNSIKCWLELNRNKVLRNQSLGLEGHSAIFYLAISGNNEGLKLYQLLGFDPRCTNIAGEDIRGYVAYSENVQAIRTCIKDLKIDITGVDMYGMGIQHKIARSGSVTGMRACKYEFNLNMNAIDKAGKGVQHHAARSGNPELIQICNKEFKLPMKLLAKNRNGIQHYAAMSGCIEAINLCVELNLDMKQLNNAQQGIQHLAAASGKYSPLERCQALGLDMKSFDATDQGLQHIAALHGTESLRFCRDMGLNMKLITKNGEGIHNMLASNPNFEFCSKQLGINLCEPPDKNFLSILESAAHSGNSQAIRFFKKSGVDISKTDKEFLRNHGVQHFAAHGGDPLTILTCAEYGIEMKEIPGVRAGAQVFAAISNNPAALLIMQLLGAPIDHRMVEDAQNDAENVTVKILAGFLASYTPTMPYLDDCKSEWNKTCSNNVVDRIGQFFYSMSKKPNSSFFSKGFDLMSGEHSCLGDLAYHLQTMRESNLVETYFYLNYYFLNLVTTKKTDFKYGRLFSFQACLCFASNQVLHAIHELKTPKENSKPSGGTHERKPSR